MSGKLLCVERGTAFFPDCSPRSCIIDRQHDSMPLWLSALAYVLIWLIGAFFVFMTLLTAAQLRCSVCFSRVDQLAAMAHHQTRRVRGRLTRDAQDNSSVANASMISGSSTSTTPPH